MKSYYVSADPYVNTTFRELHLKTSSAYELNSADSGGAGFRKSITFDSSCRFYFLSCLLLVLLTAYVAYCLSSLLPVVFTSCFALVVTTFALASPYVTPYPIITAWEQPSLTDGSSSVGVSTVRDMTLFKGDQGLN